MGRLLLALSLALAASVASGADAVALIEGSGAAYVGNLMLNQAAGDAQQQVNARALSDSADPVINIKQHGTLPAEPFSADFSARIQGDSFSAGTGVLGVNQGAGAANQQINSFRAGVKALPESLDDSSLALSAAPLQKVSATSSNDAGKRLVEIDDQAFSGSTGVVQLNQGAGVGNRMINSLGIRIVE